jgi:hypothetical protein
VIFIRSKYKSEFDLYQIYIIEDEGCYKIGYSYSVTHRIQELQVSNPRIINIIKIYDEIPNPRKYEKTIHQKLEKFKLRGEWFKCDINKLLPIVDDILNSEELIQERNIIKNIRECYEIKATEIMSAILYG